MINNGYVALKWILSNNKAITSLLGAFSTNPTFPLIKAGVLPKSENNLPALTLRPEPRKLNGNITDSYFIVNCFADDSIEANTLSETIEKQLHQTQGVADGFPYSMTVETLSQIVEEGSKQVNSPLVIRINNIGGA